MNLLEKIEKYLSEETDWKDFYKMAKSKEGGEGLKAFEKKYGSVLDRPHIKDALDNTKDFNSFLKAIKKFEK